MNRRSCGPDDERRAGVTTESRRRRRQRITAGRDVQLKVNESCYPGCRGYGGSSAEVRTTRTCGKYKRNLSDKCGVNVSEPIDGYDLDSRRYRRRRIDIARLHREPYLACSTGRNIELCADPIRQSRCHGTQRVTNPEIVYREVVENGGSTCRGSSSRAAERARAGVVVDRKRDVA